MAVTFSIQETKQLSGSPFLLLRGEKSRDADQIFVNGVYQGTSFPTVNSWERSVLLTAGDNRFLIKAKNSSNNEETAEVLVQISLPEIKKETESVFNGLDSWGLLLDTPRIIGEKNIYYSRRLQEVGTYLGGSHYTALVHASRRDLSFELSSAVLSVGVYRPTSGAEVGGTNVYIQVLPTGLLIEADQLRKDNEAVHLDPGSREWELSEEPRSVEDLRIITRSGSEITDVEILPDRKTIRVHTGPKELLATYRYVKLLRWVDYPTVSDVATALEAITGIDSGQVVEATAVGFTASEKLILTPRLLITPDTDIELSATDLKLINLIDERWQEDQLDENGLYFGSKLESVAREINARSRILFQHTILDQDRVISEDNRSLSSLPHLFDGILGYYFSLNPTDNSRYTFWDYEAYSGLSPRDSITALTHKGFLFHNLISGIGIQQTAFDVVEV